MGLIDSIFAEVNGGKDMTKGLSMIAEMDKRAEKAVKSQKNETTQSEEENQKAKEVLQSEEENQKSKEALQSEEEYQKAKEALYEKSYVCPVCDNNFKNKTLRVGKYKLVSSEDDLKPCYEPLNAEYYDVVLCENCGYAVLTNNFADFRDFQIDLIRKHITPYFNPIKFSEIYTIEEAFFRYEQALKCCIVKKGRASERAVIELRMAWIYRDLGDNKNEMKYLKDAYEDFNEAVAREVYPMNGLDEVTVLYVMSALAYKLGDTSMAKKILSKIVVKKGISLKLKTKIEDLVTLLKKN